MTCRMIVLYAAVGMVVLTMWGQASPVNGQQKSKRGADGPPRPPAVGDKAPPIKLMDQAGKERTLAEMLHDGTVAVVFYRSASW